MRESASTDLREPQGSNPLGPPGPELHVLSWLTSVFCMLFFSSLDRFLLHKKHDRVDNASASAQNAGPEDC